MTNSYKLNYNFVSNQNNGGYLISDPNFQQSEEFSETVSNVVAKGMLSTRRASAWDNDILSDQDTSWPLMVDTPRLQKSIQISPQTGERGFQWVCLVTQKNTPQLNVCFTYTLPTVKSESFSPDFHEIRNMARMLLQPTSTQVDDEDDYIPEILATSETPQVIEEAKAEKIEQDLETSIGLIREIYSTLREIKLSVKYDPEIEGRKTFCFNLTVSGDVDTILNDEVLFKKNLISKISDHAFGLIVITYNWKK
ncbi:MAG: hypothetical protein ABSE89_12180 [Sedimentisphaerales bacterium]